ncbi:MAG: DUF5683 domain-containing protein [Candidatus Limimorpha sp.]
MRRMLFLFVTMLLAMQYMRAQDTIIPTEQYGSDLTLQQDGPGVITTAGTVKHHDPKKATLLALIPGAGQAYNKKYWKIPIVYTGFGATCYFALSNNKGYRLYRDAYDFKTGTKPNVSEQAQQQASKYTESNLISIRDSYRRNMELGWILTAAWYAIQIMDAAVDAHFFYFEVDDNLTMKVEPKYNPAFTQTACGYGMCNAGVSIIINF